MSFAPLQGIPTSLDGHVTGDVSDDVSGGPTAKNLLDKLDSGRVRLNDDRWRRLRREQMSSRNRPGGGPTRSPDVSPVRTVGAAGGSGSARAAQRPVIDALVQVRGDPRLGRPKKERESERRDRAFSGIATRSGRPRRQPADHVIKITLFWRLRRSRACSRRRDNTTNERGHHPTWAQSGRASREEAGTWRYFSVITTDMRPSPTQRPPRSAWMVDGGWRGGLSNGANWAPRFGRSGELCRRAGATP